MEDFTLMEERPFKFEIIIKANSESDERNHLKLKIVFDFPEQYPHHTPTIRLKNLSVDIIDNNRMLILEEIVKNKVEENIGNPMVFEICDALREYIADMN
jgi:hypothetical protein